MKLVPKDLLQLWKETSDHPEKLILRISILRDLSRWFHAERSLHMAQGKIPQGQNLEQIEAKMAWVRGQPDQIASAPLEELLEPLPTGPAYVTALPLALGAVIPHSKLNRYDRHWEAALAVQAWERKWTFWELTATIQIQKAEVFHKHLSKLLWPKGVILFVESPPDAKPISEADGWTGRWVFIAISSLRPQHLQLESSPGLAPKAPDPIHWRQLFPV